MDTNSKRDASEELEKSLNLASKSTESPSNVVLNDLEKAAIMEMRKLYMESLKVDVDINNRIYKVEKLLEPRFEILYDRRSKLLSDYRKKVLATNNAADYNGQIAHFWLNVLKASFTDFITEDDEKILVHLFDVRSRTFLEPEVKFILQFFFDSNDFFSNKILTKTYFINIIPNPESPLTYDGGEIFASEGCQIDWKYERDSNGNSNKNGLPRFTSFFDFFDPPNIRSEDQKDAVKYNSDIKFVLQNDFDMGSFLKERVIPHAVLFFTGEIIDCQNSETESDEEVDEENDQRDVENDDAKVDENKNVADNEKDDSKPDNTNDEKNEDNSGASISKSNED